jgi:ADP-ribose pyrophosphatase YjhB (NUDIX family)
MNEWRLRFEPAISPLFRAWWRMRRPMTLGVRGVACDEAGRVLLVRHTYAHGWHLPGGGVETGETAPAAVVREMAEEGGIEAIGPPLLAGFYANHANFPNDHIALYRIETWRPCAWREGNEIAERGFFAPDSLPEGATRGTRRRMAELFAGAPVSPEW